MTLKETTEAIKYCLRPTKKLLWRLVESFRNKRLAKRYLAFGIVQVELGAGGICRPGWISLDISGGDINIDLTLSKIPFPDNSIDSIYSSHVFEHFSYPEPMLSILQDCRRCLKPGGEFNICVPDAALYIAAYMSGEYPQNAGADYYWPAFHRNSRMDIINYTAYMDGHHKHMFDADGLLAILRKAGFQNASLRKFDSSIDLVARAWESIYALATK